MIVQNFNWFLWVIIVHFNFMNSACDDDEFYKLQSTIWDMVSRDTNNEILRQRSRVLARFSTKFPRLRYRRDKAKLINKNGHDSLTRYTLSRNPKRL